MTPNFTALVVETNYLIASAIEAPLTDSGHVVVVATTDDEARTALASNRIDIAIIDFRLQHGSPDGLVARLSTAGIPYIFCTAATSQEVDEHFPGARVVEKPFLDGMLVSVVSQVVNALRSGTSG
jgi:DNA-binding response OmpR family regulator